MNKKQILVFDDNYSRASKWVSELEALKAVSSFFKVETMKIALFKEAVNLLEQRRREARKGPKESLKWDNPIDDASILVVDYDLLDLNRESYVTGETVAYLARCYSRCGLIVGLNAYGNNEFDLTLKGHPESYADLNIGSKQLANSGLWSESWDGFRPWVWPVLPDALSAFERRAKVLLKHLDDPILTYLCFPDEVIKIIPRSASQFIETSKTSSEKTTFRQFVKKSGNALSGKDAPLNEELSARIAAARIGKWLERLVIPGQDILVDAPHLVLRYPSLLKGDAQSIDTWNRVASLSPARMLGIKHTSVAQFRFAADDWLSRSVWFWKGISNHQKIPEVADPWSIATPIFVYCEDVSRFLPRDSTREFVADLPSPFVRRFVVNPRTKHGRRYAKAVAKVRYRPVVRFSL